MGQIWLIYYGLGGLVLPSNPDLEASGDLPSGEAVSLLHMVSQSDNTITMWLVWLNG